MIIVVFISLSTLKPYIVGIGLGEALYVVVDNGEAGINNRLA